MKFRKKPVMIDAIQYDGTNAHIVQGFMNQPTYSIRVGDPLLITTLEGTMRAEPGDFIIKGVNGEFYPCKPDIFKKTYELAE